MKYIIIYDTYGYRVLLKADFIIGLSLELSELNENVEHTGFTTVDEIEYIVYSAKSIDDVNFIVNRIIDDLDDTIKDFKAQHPDYP